MSLVLYIVVAVLALGILYLGIRMIGGAYLKYRGKRVVTCPETGEPAGVELAAGRAAFTSAAGTASLQLRDCSRWPERAGCGQECLRQIEAAPDGCLVRTMLTQWYADKSCVYCGKPLGEIDWIEHKPCLRSPDGRTVQWSEVPAETIPRVLETHRPVCWNCHIAETFRHEHPELVVDRDWKRT